MNEVAAKEWFADQLLDRVCTLLNISTHEIKSEPN
jgi:hypothetical protein